VLILERKSRTPSSGFGAGLPVDVGHTESETTTVKLENCKDIPVLGG